MGGLLTALRNRELVALAFGHMTVDSYVGVLPVLYPLLIGRFHLDLGTIGLLSLAYTGMSSISQPFFGLIADRWGTRFVGGALLWTAAWFASLGFAPSFPVLIAAGGIAGLGSGFFHPLGALTVRGLLSERGTNSAMSLYVSGGTFGVAMGPLIGVLVFGLLAIQGTALLLLPGLVCSAFLLAWMRANRPRRAEAAAGSKGQGTSGFVPIVPLAATVLMMMSRTWTTATLQAWVPTWYHELGYPPWFYGGLASTIVLCSAVGTIGCGSLADRFGRRTVVMVALWLSVPAVWLFVAFPGPQGFLTAALVGFLAASTSPLMLLMAQELLAARAGLASGLILGIGFMTGALGVPITGNVGDRFGLQAALLLQVAVVAATLPVAFLLPTERYLRRLRERGEGPPPSTSSAEPEEAAAGP